MSDDNPLIAELLELLSHAIISFEDSRHGLRNALLKRLEAAADENPDHARQIRRCVLWHRADYAWEHGEPAEAARLFRESISKSAAGSTDNGFDSIF